MNKTLKRLGSVVALFAVILAFLFFPLNSYTELPGSADSLKKIVRVSGHPDKEGGKFMLTTVGIVGPLTPAGWLWSQFQEAHTILPEEEVIGDQSPKEYEFEQTFDMAQAQNAAVAAAFRAAKRPVSVRDEGVVVLSVLKGSAFEKQLKPSDRIVAVNNQKKDTVEALQSEIAKHKAGETLSLTRIRHGKSKTVSGKLTRLPGLKRAGVGITLAQKRTVVSDPKVKISAGDIGGPSAGLMFALQIYSRLKEPNLRNGEKIAGTGTIDENGRVGQIGGIDKKVVAASREGARVFFAPDEPSLDDAENNYTVARKAARKLQKKIKVVPVKTLQDAINYLHQAR